MGTVSLHAFWFSVVLVITFILCIRGTFRFLILTTKIRGPSLWKLITVHARYLRRRSFLTYICKMCCDFSYKPWGLWYSTVGDYGVVVSDADTFQEIYKNKHLTNKPDQVYGTLYDYAGKGLLVLNGEQWRQHRKVANVAFHKSILEANMDIVFEGAQNIVEVVRAKAEGRSFDIGELLDEQIIDLQIRFLFSNNIVFPNTRLFSQVINHALYMAQLKLMNPVYQWILLKFHGRTREAERKTRGYIAEYETTFMELLAESKVRLENNNPPRNVFDSFVKISQDSGVFKDRDIFEESFQLLVAASEPVSTATKGALLMLALHQDAQQRVFNEIKEFIGENHQPSLKDLDRFEYLGLVVKESLRLFPSGAIILRRADEETKLSNMTIPKGTIVMLNIIALHRNPNNFKDSLKFLPERFLPDHSGDRHPFSYVPFSSGMRACIGQLHGLNVMKVLLSHLVWSYRILPGDGLNNVSDVQISLHTTLNIDETPVKLVSRCDKSN